MKAKLSMKSGRSKQKEWKVSQLSRYLLEGADRGQMRSEKLSHFWQRQLNFCVCHRAYNKSNSFYEGKLSKKTFPKHKSEALNGEIYVFIVAQLPKLIVWARTLCLKAFAVKSWESCAGFLRHFNLVSVSRLRTFARSLALHSSVFNWSQRRTDDAEWNLTRRVNHLILAAALVGSLSRSWLLSTSTATWELSTRRH